MDLPFTIEQFMAVFAGYNRAIGPMPVVLAAMALLAAALAFSSRPWAGRLISLILAVLWAWTGAVYHIGYFAELNPPAYAFGALFLLQALVFLWTGTLRDHLHFRAGTDSRGVTGGVLMLYGLAIYPLLGLAFGHAYPVMPTFGAPCPTTIFTIGLLFWLREPWPRYVLVAPILWSAVGGSAAFSLGVTEDYGLAIAGLAALVLVAAQTLQRPRGGRARTV